MASPAPVVTLLPRPLLPLFPIAIATIAAFGVAIRCNWANLSSLWTQCSSEPLVISLPFGSGAAGPPGVVRLPSTPLCFAVTFVQTAHASARSRVEQAVIVAFLAGLATVTAVESAKSQREGRHQSSGPGRRREPREGEGEKSASLTIPSENVVGVEEGRQGGSGGDGRGGGSSSSSSSSLSDKVVRNLAVSWLLYHLALGAFSWQGIIIPAFILQQKQQQEQQEQQEQQLEQPREPTSSITGTLAISLSILLGLLLPASVMLLNPSAPAPILAWLAFPIWVSLIHRTSSALFGGSSSSNSNSSRLVYVLPVLASVAAHGLLIAHFLCGAKESLMSDHHDQDQGSSSSLTRSAMLLLEVDHAALFATVLYWIFNTDAGLRAVAVTLVATLTLGPGAGVCIGWMYRDYNLQQQQQQQQQQHRSVHLTSSQTVGQQQLRAGRRTTRRRTYGKATGHFFGGPLVE